MTYQIIIKEEALEDTREAYNYYENLSEGLGERFLEKLEAAYTSLSLYPTNFGFIDDKKILRDKIVDVFPFTVIYSIKEKNVIIVAVHNCYKHPDKRYR
ncbi:MAG: type II toxin-antitoxin system RelE/ParE family toxin [Bacteroidota bacterium]|nr:type II toxin-antitoxin system RelE/ParE family toxin [Bacteroidota bacterium]